MQFSYLLFCILAYCLQHGTRPVLDTDVNLKTLGESTECAGYTGADLAALVREAGIEALKELMTANNTSAKLVVSSRHFSRALRMIRPSVSGKVKLMSLELINFIISCVIV
jgi:ribosome biogenesis ATPase